MKNIYSIFFILLCQADIVSQTCERTGHIITFDNKVQLETKNPSVMVRFFFSRDPALSVKVRPPKVISYRYNGKIYDAKEFGFENYRPRSAFQSLITNCFTKLQANFYI